VPDAANLSVYPSDRAIAGLILAHGAGAGQRSRFMVEAARAMAARGVTTATFDFPYIAEGRRMPDKGPVLEDAWRAAIASARLYPALSGLPLVIGGKSMGGRIASQVAAHDSAHVTGVIYFGYPLHPPGKPEQRRDRHLPAISVPMLFVQGTRDTFGTAAEIHELLPQLNARTTLVEVGGGDHSFKVPARSGRTPEAVLDSIFDAAAAFIRSAIAR
jgi:predicted alpha/beta-hydrolase family hydrolase